MQELLHLEQVKHEEIYLHIVLRGRVLERREDKTAIYLACHPYDEAGSAPPEMQPQAKAVHFPLTLSAIVRGALRVFLKCFPVMAARRERSTPCLSTFPRGLAQEQAASFEADRNRCRQNNAKGGWLMPVLRN